MGFRVQGVLRALNPKTPSRFYNERVCDFLTESLLRTPIIQLNSRIMHAQGPFGPPQFEKLPHFACRSTTREQSPNSRKLAQALGKQNREPGRHIANH